MTRFPKSGADSDISVLTREGHDFSQTEKTEIFRYQSKSTYLMKMEISLAAQWHVTPSKSQRRCFALPYKIETPSPKANFLISFPKLNYRTGISFQNQLMDPLNSNDCVSSKVSYKSRYLFSLDWFSFLGVVDHGSWTPLICPSPSKSCSADFPPICHELKYLMRGPL